MSEPDRQHVFDDDILHQLDQIDEELPTGLEDDARLASGVPESQRGDDLEFIEMTGLTTEGDDEEEPVEAAVQNPDLDPQRPISFYEKGVADVDESLAPGILETAAQASEEIVPETMDAAESPGLRELLEQRLAQEHPVEKGAAALVDIPEGDDFAEDTSAGEPEELSPDSDYNDDRLEEAGTPQGLEPGFQQDDADEPDDDIAGAYEDQSQEDNVPGEDAVVYGPDDLTGMLTDEDMGQPEGLIAAEAEEETNARPDLGEAEEYLEELQSQTASAGDANEDDDIADLERLLKENQPPAMDDEPEDATGETPDEDYATGELVEETTPMPSEMGHEESPEEYPLSMTDAGSGPMAEELAAAPVAASPPEEEDLLPHDVESVEAPRRQTSRSHKRRVKRRRLLRIVGALFAVAILAGLCYLAYDLYWQRAETPEALLRRAQEYAQEGKHRAAYQRYNEFLKRFPTHPERGTAQFMAAFSLQLSPPEGGSLTEQQYDEAIALLKQFIEDNPAHQKVPRAQSLIGILYYRLGQYGHAIDWLRDPELRLKDSGAETAILRTLARSYAMRGEVAKAEGAYLQAAAIEENPSPDADYNELGNLFLNIAEGADTAEAAGAAREKAITYWQHAVHFPGITPPQRRQIEDKIELQQEKLSIGGQAEMSTGMTPIAVPETAPDAEPLLEEPLVDAVEEMPVAPPEAPVEVEPGIEAMEAENPVAAVPAEPVEAPQVVAPEAVEPMVEPIPEPVAETAPVAEPAAMEDETPPATDAIPEPPAEEETATPEAGTDTASAEAAEDSTDDWAIGLPEEDWVAGQQPAPETVIDAEPEQPAVEEPEAAPEENLKNTPVSAEEQEENLLPAVGAQ